MKKTINKKQQNRKYNRKNEGIQSKVIHLKLSCMKLRFETFDFMVHVDFRNDKRTKILQQRQNQHCTNWQN